MKLGAGIRFEYRIPIQAGRQGIDAAASWMKGASAVTR